MSRTAQIAAIGAFFALVLVGLLTGGDERDMTATSFGKASGGHGAVYDLMRELGFPVARSFVPPAELPPDRTVWWIHPDDGCAAASLEDEAFTAWIRNGGTAVVFLARSPDTCKDGAALAGLELPARIGCGCEVEAPVGPAAAAAPEGPAPSPAPEPEPELTTIEGPLVRAARKLELRRRVHFLPASEWSDGTRGDGEVGSWEVGATQDGEPFALDRRLGAGRLVVVADGRFLENAGLGAADAAPLAVDLAIALGTPWIDERSHGLVPSRDTLDYLAGSPAATAFVGLALLALAFAWLGAAEPPRRVAELDLDAPTLETYVASLAGLYAATRDHARVLERYREVSARRLRRRFGLPPDAPLAALLERLTGRRRLPRAGIEELRSEERARGAADLARRAAILDRLVEEATR